MGMSPSGQPLSPISQPPVGGWRGSRDIRGQPAMSGTTWIRIGAVFGTLAVAAGAFGAHILRGRLEARMLDIFETAARYQMYHALALLVVGLLATSARPGLALTVAG